LGGYFVKYAAQNLYMVTGSRAIETRERGYAHPMSLRNKASRIPDEVVDALHSAVINSAAPLARRYYKLKAQLLGLPTLAWSDRNAPMPFADTTKVPYAEAEKMVLAAYESFSPTLAGLVRQFIEQKRIDAPAVKGKRSGAFNSSTVLPGNIPASVTFLNYLGSPRDVMTLAHEVGHGVHSMLAGKTQGVLMMEYPMAYAETASVFGELTTFNFLIKELKQKNDDEALLALVMGKLDDMMNTVVRQIGFSNFERRIHGMDESYTVWHEPKKLSVEEINTIWLATLAELYGKEGEVFTYKNTEHLWSYVSHFHRPFYVYAYAFGELLTQSIYAKKEELSARFEPLYLEMLSSGMTRDVVELTKPFGLDPTHTDFWTNGIRAGMETLLAEAETLAQK
jgi:oligoendopeptidase F